MSLHAVRNNLKKYFTREKVFDSLFLAFLCLIYSIVALTNLGETVAPQTFYRMKVHEELVITLPKKLLNPKVALYSGITENGFELSYALVKDGESLNDVHYSSLGFDGPFKWMRISTAGDASKIILRNDAGRDIDIGEIAVFSNSSNRVDGISLSRNTIETLEEPADDTDLRKMLDEQEMATLDATVLNSTYFDELYFAQTAYQYATNQFGYEAVHPPLGKIIQSIPIRLTGKMTPFTWRVMGAITGILIIIATYFLAKEIFHKASFARVAAILISLSGLHFVQTRVGTVDSYLCLFTILSFLFMMKFVNSDKKLRYFILSGIFFGCAWSVKWSGAFAGIGLALLFFAKLKAHIFQEGERKWILRGAFSFIFIPLVIYCSSYLLFPETTGAHNLGDVFNQTSYLLSYHSHENTPHAYSSMWYTWPIALKPILYAKNLITGRTISLMANYSIAYVSVLGLIVTGYFAFRKKDKISLIIIVSWLSLFAPYIFITRTMFLYHYLPASVFAILAIVNLFYQLPSIRKILLAYLLAVLVSFIVCYPKMVGV